MFALANSPCSLVSVLALLLIVTGRMFLHHVKLERKRSAALVVAVITGKRLLASVRSHVFFKIFRFSTRKVALVTLKRPLP